MIPLICIIYTLIGLYLLCNLIVNNVEVIKITRSLGLFFISTFIIILWPLILTFLLIIKYNEETTQEVSEETEEVHETSWSRGFKNNSDTV